MHKIQERTPGLINNFSSMVRNVPWYKWTIGVIGVGVAGGIAYIAYKKFFSGPSPSSSKSPSSPSVIPTTKTNPSSTSTPSRTSELNSSPASSNAKNEQPPSITPALPPKPTQDAPVPAKMTESPAAKSTLTSGPTSSDAQKDQPVSIMSALPPNPMQDAPVPAKMTESPAAKSTLNSGPTSSDAQKDQPANITPALPLSSSVAAKTNETPVVNNDAIAPIEFCSHAGVEAFMQATDKTAAVIENFSKINSSQFMDAKDLWPTTTKKPAREEIIQFCERQHWDRENSTITAYDRSLVTNELLNLLTYQKAAFASGQKTFYLDRPLKNDGQEGKVQILNVEAIFSAFTISIYKLCMVGEPFYNAAVSAHAVAHYGRDQIRNVVAVEECAPDFEMEYLGNKEDKEKDDYRVMAMIAELREEAIVGAMPSRLPERPAFSSNIPNKEKRKNAMYPAIKDYTDVLVKFLIANLTQAGRLPSKKEANMLSKEEALELLTGLVKSTSNNRQDITNALQNQAVKIPNQVWKESKKINVEHCLSLEVLYNVYLRQQRLKFTLLEKFLPQGYVCSIDPPAIFAKSLGEQAANVDLLNLLQILAIKQVSTELKLTNLKLLAFNDYKDKKALALLKELFSDKVVSKDSLFDQKTHYYNRTEEWAYAESTLGDAFASNAQTEGCTSRHGALAVSSNLAYLAATLPVKQTGTVEQKDLLGCLSQRWIAQRNPYLLKHAIGIHLIT